MSHVAHIAWLEPDPDTGQRLIERARRQPHQDRPGADDTARAWAAWAANNPSAKASIWVEDYTDDGHLLGRRTFTANTAPPAADSIAAARRSLDR